MPPRRIQPIVKAGAALIVVLLLAVQPNWTPLLDDLRIARRQPTLTDESLAAILDAYARQPWHPDRAHSAALAALASGDYESARSALQHAADIKGWTPELHMAMGDALLGLGKRREAVQEWETALPGRLNDTALLTKLAVAYEAEGRYPEAAAVLRTLVSLEPTNAVAQYRFGVVLSVIDPPAAPSHLALAAGLDESVRPFAESLDRAVAAGLDANDPAYTAGVVGYTLIGLQEYQLAKAALLNAVSARPDFAEAHAYLGLAEDRLGNDGRYAYERALAIDDRLALAHYLLGVHYRRAGDNQRAIPELKRAFDLDVSNAAAAAELGSAYTELADLPTAEEWYVQAVRVAPQDGNFWLLLAQFYLDHDLKVETDGRLAANKAADLLPGSALALDAVGYAEYLNGRTRQAEDKLLQAQSLDPESARVYFHLGLVYLDTNRPAEAKQALQNAVALDAGGPVATMALQALARLGPP